jgi:hypothetical protein
MMSPFSTPTIAMLEVFKETQWKAYENDDYGAAMKMFSTSENGAVFSLQPVIFITTL